MNPRRRIALERTGLIALLITGLTRSASAHAGLAGVSELWNGALHPLLDVAQGVTLAALGLGMARVQTSGGTAPFRPFQVGFALGLAGGMLLLPSGMEFLGPLPMIAVGLALIDPGGWLGARPAAVFGIIAALAGLAFGAGIPAGIARPVFACGMFFAAVLLPVYAAAFWESFHRPWFNVAARIMGSWLVAIALMLLGGSLRR